MPLRLAQPTRLVLLVRAIGEVPRVIPWHLVLPGDSEQLQVIPGSDEGDGSGTPVTQSCESEPGKTPRWSALDHCDSATVTLIQTLRNR